MTEAIDILGCRVRPVRLPDGRTLHVRKLTPAMRENWIKLATEEADAIKLRSAQIKIALCLPDGSPAATDVDALPEESIARLYAAAAEHNGFFAAMVDIALEQLQDYEIEERWMDIAWHFGFYDVAEAKQKIGTDRFCAWLAWLRSKNLNHEEVHL